MNVDDVTTSNLRFDTPTAEEIIKASLIIWDEVSQCSSHIINCVDRLLRDLMNNPYVPFGGKCIVIAGDFRQCLPIMSEFVTPENISSFLLHKSSVWTYIRHLSLNQNMRVLPHEKEFSSWLINMGNGELPTLKNSDLIEIPSRVVVPISKSLVDELYGTGLITLDLIKNSNMAILCVENEDCFKINDECLKRFEGDDIYRFTSTDTIEMENDQTDLIPIENAYAERPSGFPRDEIKLKVGCVVMLLRNLCLLYGLCNGTRLIVERCYEDSIHATILNGAHKDETYLIPKTHFEYSGSKLSYKLTRVQLPLRLAFAITINKSQGQTLDKVGLWLSRPVFTHGQLYVACSRVRSFDSLKIQVNPVERGQQRQGELNGKTYTRNIVYKGVLKHYI